MRLNINPAKMNALRKLAPRPLNGDELREQKIPAGIVQSLIDETLVEVIVKKGKHHFRVTRLGKQVIGQTTTTIPKH
jgi:hypothetical protein